MRKCDYCDNGKRIVDEKYIGFAVGYGSKKNTNEYNAYINGCDRDGWDISKGLIVNYCPMCGKKLKIKNEQFKSRVLQKEDDRVSTLSSKILSLEKKLYSEIDALIHQELGFKGGERLYYSCNGSGYYIVFDRIESKYIIGTITNKTGKSKDKIFKIHWCYADTLERIN